MQAGCTGVFAVEKSADAFKTLDRNLCNEDGTYRFDWPRWLPKKSMAVSTLIRNHKTQLKRLRGKIDLIAGGPPCQGFSTAGLRNPDDPRNKLTKEYIRVVDLVRPKFLLIENVRGFQARFADAKEAYSKSVEKRLNDVGTHGYNVFSALVKAADFGIPQSRCRFIMIGVRKDVCNGLQDPVDSLLKSATDFRRKKGLHGKHVTVADAIADLCADGKEKVEWPDDAKFEQIEYSSADVCSAFQKLLRSEVSRDFVPNSLRLPNHRPATITKFKKILEECEKGKVVPKEFRKSNGIHKRSTTPLHPDKIAHTVTTLPDDFIHYCEPRILTVRENARLQTFPDWFEFHGKYTTGGKKRRVECPRYTQVGNAVPPLLAEAIGRTLAELAH